MDRTSQRHPTRFLAALGLGAALMYLLDPQAGRGRVARARDRAARLARQGRDTARAGARDLSNRVTGLLARARGALQATTPDDDVLLERVRAQLGRWVSHPHAIEVSAVDGWVTLGGPVLAHEAGGLVRATWAVRGVRQVKDQLVRHAANAALPQRLDGHRSRPRSEFVPDQWAPGPRLAVLGVAAGLALYAARRRGAQGVLAGIAGAALAARTGTHRRGSRRAGAAGEAGGASRGRAVAAHSQDDALRAAALVDGGEPPEGAPAWSETGAAGRPLASASR
jgi:hypothetical protein